MPDALHEFEAGYADIEDLLEETGRGVEHAVHNYMWRSGRTALLSWAARTHFTVEKRIYEQLPLRSVQARQLVERGLEEHLVIHEQLVELDRTVGCDPQTWLATFEQLRTVLELHAFEAEAVLIPYARRQLRRELRDGAMALQGARGVCRRGRASL